MNKLPVTYQIDPELGFDPKHPYYPYGPDNEAFLPTIVHDYPKAILNITYLIPLPSYSS